VLGYLFVTIHPRNKLRGILDKQIKLMEGKREKGKRKRLAL